MTALTPAARTLVEQMGAAPRGPKRDGCFAVWLVVRVVEDLALDPPQPENATQRRIALLERRLSSLTLAPQLKRALAGIISSLRQPARPEPSRMLLALAGPVRDTIGDESADALLRAARTIRSKP